ncbi:DUF6269 family protein [Streptomyces apocyni]|uniref:DUF6269 family protein n=1 Tax=Streptomyces apocyni TaxID=2654677 RepID=UPI00227792F7|nr:DUF6269 family protein [Streptomyces apocyni]
MSERAHETEVVPHPLEVMNQVESKMEADQEMALRQSHIPWQEVLVECADQLTELSAPGSRVLDPLPEYGLDGGHAGGCG